jgi:hypothetical protein
MFMLFLCILRWIRGSNNGLKTLHSTYNRLTSVFDQVFLQRYICGAFSSPTVIGCVWENLLYFLLPPPLQRSS